MQLPLQFEFQSSQTFDSFFPEGNREIITQLMAVAEHCSEQQLYIWGAAGSGKTHLLQACCQQARINGLESFYLAFDAEALPSPAIIEGLDEMALVCLDDVETIAGNADWEHALFDFYNRHRQNNHKLVLAADCPPKFLPIDLLDLKTRMAWGLTLKIQSLREDQLIDALRHKARFLGFDLPEQVGRFLLNHYVHDWPALWQLLARIDRATLSEQRKLSVPFLKKILADQSIGLEPN